MLRPQDLVKMFASISGAEIELGKVHRRALFLAPLALRKNESTEKLE
jgi:hypothetical protein